MKRKKIIETDPFGIEEKLVCKNPANVHYLRSAYIYAYSCGYRDEAHKAEIESALNMIKIEEKEFDQDWYNAIVEGIANKAIHVDLQYESHELNQLSVDEAIERIAIILREKRLKLLGDTYASFFPKRTNEHPLQHEQWIRFQIDWYEIELNYFKELKAVGKHSPRDNSDRSESYIKLALPDDKANEAINLIHVLLNNHLIKASPEEFKVLFAQPGKQKVNKVEWLGSQAEIKAFVDLLKNNRLIENRNVNQLAEACFFSTKHSINARTLGSVTAQNTYVLLSKEQDANHVLSSLIIQLVSLRA